MATAIVVVRQSRDHIAANEIGAVHDGNLAKPLDALMKQPKVFLAVEKVTPSVHFFMKIRIGMCFIYVSQERSYDGEPHGNQIYESIRFNEIIDVDNKIVIAVALQ